MLGVDDGTGLSGYIVIRDPRPGAGANVFLVCRAAQFVNGNDPPGVTVPPADGPYPMIADQAGPPVLTVDTSDLAPGRHHFQLPVFLRHAFAAMKEHQSEVWLHEGNAEEWGRVESRTE
jgi:hypothetical protein